MPKVSVIIPTYNRGKFIVETLQSVFAQTFTDYEVIVIDDGSTDNTSDVLKPYLDRIIYIPKPNGGQGSARNAGIKIAKGEYIAFLDSDDLWLADKLELQVRYLDENKDIGLVFSDYINFSEDSNGSMIDLDKKKFAGSELSFNSLFRRNFISNLTVMTRRDCFETLGYFDESRDLMWNPDSMFQTTDWRKSKISNAQYGEDYEMWLRIAMKYKLAHIPESLAKYRVHPDNVLGTDLEKGCVMHLRVIQSILKKYPDIPEMFNISMYDYYRDFYYRTGRNFYQSGLYEKALKNLKKSLTYRILAPKALLLLFLAEIRRIFPG